MPGIEFKYDVFVSYSSINKEWVRKIFVPALEKAGLKVCDYYRDFDVGAAIVKEMERAVLESRKTILVLSPAYLKSAWTEFENLMLQTLDAANQQRRLLPVIIEKCDLPLRIKYMNCINFANPDDVDIEWERLSRALEVTLYPSLLETAKPNTGSRDTWHLAHPYPMPPNFTGRATELKMLDDWLADNINRLFILRALGGFGKSALAWQWINTHVNPAEWTKLVWWSFYEGDASFEHFIEETLKYLKLEVPQSRREQIDELLKAMQAQKVLLILDGFERLLRAYSNMNASYQGDADKKIDDADRDCVSLDTEQFLKGICSMPNMKGKALMTTRLTPSALEKFGQFIQGCREEELKAMDKEDAIAFFRAQGVHKGTNHEIEDVCRLYGFHPLSLRLLVGHIMTDFKNTGDIVVAQKVKVSGDIAEHQNHILEVSYNILSSRQQKLLSTIACFRSSTKLETLESIVENKETSDDDLHDLMERGLLQFDKKNNVFDLHPIVRRYAYWRFTDGARKEAHTKLAEHFIDAMPVTNRNVKTLEDLAPVIELYHHMVGAGNLDEAIKLFHDRIWKTLFYNLGGYQLQIELLRALFLDGEDKPPRLKDESAQAWTLNELANTYALSGQPRRAVPLFEMHNSLREIAGDKKNLARGLSNVACIAQIYIGALRDSENNQRRHIDLLRATDDQFGEAVGRQELAYVLSYRGAWQEAEQELDFSFNFDTKQSDYQGLSVDWSYRALRFLLMARDNPKSQIENLKSSIECAQRALELADETAKTRYTHPRDYVRAYWLLGSAYRANWVSTGSTLDLTLAEENLSKALNLCRQINLVVMEANILLDVARLRYAQGNFKDAQEKASEALVITERSGYVLQGADVNLFLAQYALEQEQDKAKAKQYAEEAKKLATCDGPPYYYKVAYEEAERFLKKLNT